jgi:hypothetical protein
MARLALRIHSILLYELDLAALVATYFGSWIPIQPMIHNSSMNNYQGSSQKQLCCDGGKSA